MEEELHEFEMSLGGIVSPRGYSMRLCLKNINKNINQIGFIFIKPVYDIIIVLLWLHLQS